MAKRGRMGRHFGHRIGGRLKGRSSWGKSYRRHLHRRHLHYHGNSG